jgi:hypothetical protein
MEALDPISRTSVLLELISHALARRTRKITGRAVLDVNAEAEHGP